MRIILIGYRASGKTTLGQLVADQLDWPLLDVDRGIEQQSGMTLKALFEQGETQYREIERQVVAQMCTQDRTVISFGAGTIIEPANQRIARDGSLVVYLELPAEELWRRIQADPNSATTRPNLSCGGINEVVEMLERRSPVYEQCSDLRLDATLTPEQLATKIVSIINQQQN